eukprot:CAMPEP_0172707178 /NCGR_PEP_ID=MMETSP1074-20121228/48767_1 /TAXON_ID=2916 /ORGANISM="Ceratium fusus, Strain PA161109" /LENGTH=116 /DNA_ID=CAMNT_0013529941 /DNA_START=50 /DNA_END=397 /DNA_ORIENTATION=+
MPLTDAQKKAFEEESAALDEELDRLTEWSKMLYKNKAMASLKEEFPASEYAEQWDQLADPGSAAELAIRNAFGKDGTPDQIKAVQAVWKKKMNSERTNATIVAKDDNSVVDDVWRP